LGQQVFAKKPLKKRAMTWRGTERSLLMLKRGNIYRYESMEVEAGKRDGCL
jgi:hypothetical protein